MLCVIGLTVPSAFIWVLFTGIISPFLTLSHIGCAIPVYVLEMQSSEFVFHDVQICFISFVVIFKVINLKVFRISKWLDTCPKTNTNLNKLKRYKQVLIEN